MKPTIEELEKILNDPNPHRVEITPSGKVVMAGLGERIRHAINSVSAENGSDTPDYILADYLTSCLAAFDRATQERDRWYQSQVTPPPPPRERKTEDER